jgi:hypothetical protein
MGMTSERRSGDIWLLAGHPGDVEFKSTVQQFNMRIPLRNKEGMEQHIHFAPIADVTQTAKSVSLTATSDSGMPIYYYVQEGPAELKDGKLIFTTIPPRSKFPVKVTVVAWQYGRSIEPKVETAEPVIQSFNILK